MELINENNIRFNTNITLREDRVFFYNYLKQVRYIHYLNISNYNYFYREGSAVSKNHSYHSYHSYILEYSSFIKEIFINNNINISNSYIEIDFSRVQTQLIYKFYKTNKTNNYERLKFLKQMYNIKLFDIRYSESYIINLSFKFFNRNFLKLFDFIFRKLI